MKYRVKLTVFRALKAVACCALVGLAGCDGSSDIIVDPGAYGVYNFRASVVIDPNVNKTTVVADFELDSANLALATVVFNGDTLLFDQPSSVLDSIFSQSFSWSQWYPVGPENFIVEDGSALVDTMQINLPGDPYIVGIDPPDRQSQGAGPVTLDFTAADSADGYIVVAVKRGDAYNGRGWSGLADMQNTEGTILTDAFLFGPGLQPDTGWYYVYVYAYSNAPDSALTAYLLPTPLPLQFADNLTGANLKGRVGSVRVSAHDSVHVVASP